MIFGSAKYALAPGPVQKFPPSTTVEPPPHSGGVNTSDVVTNDGQPDAGAGGARAVAQLTSDAE